MQFVIQNWGVYYLFETKKVVGCREEMICINFSVGFAFSD